MTNSPELPIFSAALAQHLQQPTPEFLYHYTGQNGLIGIISARSLRATNIIYLNDATEFESPLKMIQEQLSEQQKNCQPESNRHRNATLFKTLINAYFGATYKEVLHEIYVACFCAKDDLLSQWLGYAGNDYGYCIALRVPKLQNTIRASGFMLGKCIYDREVQHKIIDEALNYVIELPSEESVINFAHLLRYVALFKDQSFSQEEEWGLVSTKPVESTKIEFRPGKSMIIPYTSINIGADDNELEFARPVRARRLG